MSIQTELTRITNAKTAIKTAIEGKGVTVPDGTLLDGMAALIESIQAGGGGDGEFFVTSGKITYPSKILLKDNPIVIEHGLPKKPCVFFAACGASGDYSALALSYAYYATTDFGYLRTTYPLIAYATSAGSDSVSISSYADLITADNTSVSISYKYSKEISMGADYTSGELTWVALARK